MLSCICLVWRGCDRNLPTAAGVCCPTRSETASAGGCRSPPCWLVSSYSCARGRRTAVPPPWCDRRAFACVLPLALRGWGPSRLPPHAAAALLVTQLARGPCAGAPPGRATNPPPPRPPPPNARPPLPQFPQRSCRCRSGAVAALAWGRRGGTAAARRCPPPPAASHRLFSLSPMLCIVPGCHAPPPPLYRVGGWTPVVPPLTALVASGHRPRPPPSRPQPWE